MASNLRVDTILPSTGTSLGIGTASGTTTVTGTLNAASATITGNLGVGGVLTYEDVTNIDSVGIVTARLGINLVGNDLNVGSNIKIGNASGIVTATSFSGDGSALTGVGLGTDGSANTSGIITATAFVSTQGQLSNRNIIINGAMSVAQRGSSSTSSGYHTVDRFQVNYNGTDEAPEQRAANLGTGDAGPYEEGFRKALKVTNGNQTSGAGASDFIRTLYYVEAQDLATSGWNYKSSSSYITLQFWVKVSVAQTYYVNFRSFDGTQKMYCFSMDLSANTWTKVTHTIPGHADISFDNDTGQGMYIQFYQYRGTNNSGTVTLNQWNNYSGSILTPDQTTTWYTTNDATYELTGVQLEVGPVATPFEHRSYGDELQRCMRYYEGVYMTDGTALMKSYASYGGSSNFEYQFKVEKRTTPTFSLEGNASWSGATPTAYESRSACLFQHNGGTLFSLGDAHDDLCASFTAEL